MAPKTAEQKGGQQSKMATIRRWIACADCLTLAKIIPESVRCQQNGMAENERPKKLPNHLRSLHERQQEKRLIVILEKASLETVKVGDCRFLDSLSSKYKYRAGLMKFFSCV